jgi:hypothetical protein
MSAEPSWLRHAAQRSSLECWSLGRLLSRCRELEGSSDEMLAAELDCDVQTILWLSLCRLPSEARFVEEVRQVCSRFGLDSTRLAALLRRAQALEALTVQADVYEEASDQFLLAARDRDDEDDSR